MLRDVARIDSALRELGVPAAPPLRLVGEPVPVAQPRNVLGRQPRERSTGPTATLLATLRQNRGKEFNATSAYDLLIKSGWTTESDNPRNVVASLLAKLARRGVVSKVRPGVYLIPAEVDTPDHGQVMPEPLPDEVMPDAETTENNGTAE